MKNSIYKLVCEYKQRIWGGARLQEVYGFETDVEPLGEAWIVTSLKGNADNRIEGLEMSLNDLYQNHRELFGTDDDLLPVKAMLIAANDDLSVQVHPNDEYALKHDNSLGKPEAWYVIDAKEGARIEYGHTASSKEEFANKVKDGKWDELLKYVYPKKGDFLYVQDGMLHALGKDLLVYEISKNADLTYRVYDYDRVDNKTKMKRELHIDKCLDVVRVGEEGEGLIHPEGISKDGCVITTYMDEPKMFTFKRIEVADKGEYEQEEFGFYFVSEGKGQINNQKVQKGETYFVPKGYGLLKFQGNLELLLSTYRQ